MHDREVRVFDASASASVSVSVRSFRVCQCVEVDGTEQQRLCSPRGRCWGNMVVQCVYIVVHIRVCICCAGYGLRDDAMTADSRNTMCAEAQRTTHGIRKPPRRCVCACVKYNPHHHRQGQFPHAFEKIAQARSRIMYTFCVNLFATHGVRRVMYSVMGQI